MYTLRNITEADAPVLRYLAKRCYPLDVHTQYIYWVVAKYYGEGGFILEKDGEPVGYLMTVDARKALFVWQIGILPAHRGKGLSQMLIHETAEYAKSMGKNLEVTIAEENLASFSAFQRYCERHGMLMEKAELVEVRDLDDPDFQEKEVRYILSLHF